MDMSHQLRTLPPEALDILRFYRGLNTRSAHADDIIDGADLSDRGFGKAIRRLVTKNYLVMDGDQVYRLSDMGQRAVEALGTVDLNPLDAFDSDYEDDDDDDGAMEWIDDDEDPFAGTGVEVAVSASAEAAVEPRSIKRHLVLVAPRVLRAGQPTNVFVGFDAAADDEFLFSPLEVILRLNVLHGEPDETTETSLVLENRAVHKTFELVAGSYQQARIRVEVCQLNDDLLEPDGCGGLYADLPVGADDVDTTLAAYGADLELREAPPSEDDLTLNEYDFE